MNASSLPHFKMKQYNIQFSINMNTNKNETEMESFNIFNVNNV